jgi:hypothetical protein
MKHFYPTTIFLLSIAFVVVGCSESGIDTEDSLSNQEHSGQKKIQEEQILQGSKEKNGEEKRTQNTSDQGKDTSDDVSVYVNEDGQRMFRNNRYGFEVLYPDKLLYEETPVYDPTKYKVRFVTSKDNPIENTKFSIEVDTYTQDEGFSGYFGYGPTTVKDIKGKNYEVTVLDKGICDMGSCGPPFLIYRIEHNSSFYGILFGTTLDYNNENVITIMESFSLL